MLAWLPLVIPRIFPKPYYVNYKIRVPKILRSPHASRRSRHLRVGV